MLRKDIRCRESHTELSPGKLGARLWWLTRVKPNQDIVTISQGGLDHIWAMSVFRGWQGSLIPCDIDPGVVATLTALWEDVHGQGALGAQKHRNGRATYPGLALHAPGGDIRATVVDYCASKYGARCGEVILDVDLTGTARECWPIMLDVMGTCKGARQKARMFLTFLNGRDEFKSLDQRIAWMRDNLPRGAVYNGHHAYVSGRIRHDASRTKGSPMCVAEFLI